MRAVMQTMKNGDMDNIYSTIKNSHLWNGISRDEFAQMYKCMDANTRRYDRGVDIISTGERANAVGLVLSGSVKIIKEDVDGNPTILAEFTVPEIFGETFACADVEHSPVTVQAADNCWILFLNYKKIVASCPSACGFHSRLIENMLKLIASKNMLLNQKIEILSKRSTRDKLLAFFDFYRGGANKFSIPYNREELARYLCVDRSAMSGELCKMRDSGLIRFHKNEFELISKK